MVNDNRQELDVVSDSRSMSVEASSGQQAGGTSTSSRLIQIVAAVGLVMLLILTVQYGTSRRRLMLAPLTSDDVARLERDIGQPKDVVALSKCKNVRMTSSVSKPWRCEVVVDECLAEVACDDHKCFGGSGKKPKLKIVDTGKMDVTKTQKVYEAKFRNLCGDETAFKRPDIDSYEWKRAAYQATCGERIKAKEYLIICVDTCEA